MAESVSPAQVIVGLLGGLVVFLLGLDWLSKALRDQTGDGLRRLLARLTNNRFVGLLTGAAVTMLLQSSTITTVLAVGLVSGGILTFTQSLGVVLGANIGTTATAQIIAFDTAFLGMAMLIAGYLLGLVRNKRQATAFGSVLLGLGMVFLGMVLMSNSVRPLRDYQPFLDAMATLSNPIVGLFVGAAFTAVVQSSTAATGVAIALSAEGLIPIEAGVAILIGANVGTCVTALLAAIGKPPAALRTAVFHVIVNLSGAIVWFLAIEWLIDAAVAVAPSYPELTGIERQAAETPRQFAMAHTIFNVSTALVLIWFLGPIGRFLQRAIPDRPVSEPPGAPRYLASDLLLAPWPAMEATRAELGELAAQTRSVLQRFQPVALAPTDEAITTLAADEVAINRRYRGIVRFLRDLEDTDLAPEASQQSAALMDYADDIEGLANVVDRQLTMIQRTYPEVGATLRPDTRRLLVTVDESMLRYFDAVVAVMRDNQQESVTAAEVAGDTAHRELRAVTSGARQLLREGEGAVRRYAVVEDLLDQYRIMLDRLDRIVRVAAKQTLSEVDVDVDADA
jgi:phosphate:Na+ symporter